MQGRSGGWKALVKGGRAHLPGDGKSIFNDGTCRFPNSCRYLHICQWCGALSICGPFTWASPWETRAPSCWVVVSTTNVEVVASSLGHLSPPPWETRAPSCFLQVQWKRTFCCVVYGHSHKCCGKRFMLFDSQ